MIIKKMRGRFNGARALIVRPKIGIREVSSTGDKDTLNEVLEVGGKREV